MANELAIDPKVLRRFAEVDEEAKLRSRQVTEQRQKLIDYEKAHRDIQGDWSAAYRALLDAISAAYTADKGS